MGTRKDENMGGPGYTRQVHAYSKILPTVHYSVPTLCQEATFNATITHIQV